MDSLNFNYYTRQAITNEDRLFHSDVVPDLLDDRELSVLQDFVAEYKPNDMDSPLIDQLDIYAPDISHANTVSLSSVNVVRTAQFQHKSELLVAEENLQYKSNCLNLAIPASSIPIPRTYSEAKASKYWTYWADAIKSEFNTLISNGTWRYIKGKSFIINDVGISCKRAS